MLWTPTSWLFARAIPLLRDTHHHHASRPTSLHFTVHRSRSPHWPFHLTDSTHRPQPNLSQFPHEHSWQWPFSCIHHMLISSTKHASIYDRPCSCPCSSHVHLITCLTSMYACILHTLHVRASSRHHDIVYIMMPCTIQDASYVHPMCISCAFMITCLS